MVGWGGGGRRVVNLERLLTGTAGQRSSPIAYIHRSDPSCVGFIEPKLRSHSLALACAAWRSHVEETPEISDLAPCIGTLFRFRNEHISIVGNLPRYI